MTVIPRPIRERYFQRRRHKMRRLRSRTFVGAFAMLVAAHAIVAQAGSWFINIPSTPMDYTPTNNVFVMGAGYAFTLPNIPPMTTVAFKYYNSNGTAMIENWVTVTGTFVPPGFWSFICSIPPAPTWTISPLSNYYPFSFERKRDHFIDESTTGISSGHRVNP